MQSRIKHVCLAALLMLTCIRASGGEANPAERDSEVKPALVTIEDHFAHVDMPALPFKDIAKVGEKHVYLLKSNGIPAGETTFTVKRVTRLKGKPVYYLTMETESNDAISFVYRVRDKIKSYVDAETGYSLLFQRSIHENDYRADDYLQFDYAAKKQYYSAVKYNKPGRPQKKKPPRPIPGPLQDPLSVLYYLRHFSMEVGDTKEVLVGTRKRTNVLQLKIIREEEITVARIGRFDAQVIQVGAANGNYEAGVFIANGDITLWVEKNTNIPLKLKVGGIPVLGSAMAVLKQAENSPLHQHAKR